MTLQKKIGKRITRVLQLVADLRIRCYQKVHFDKFSVHSDSRGFNINRKDRSTNPFYSYPVTLIKNFWVDFLICPEKHTTLVDFSPRPRSIAGRYFSYSTKVSMLFSGLQPLRLIWTPI
jgi:hypothetical protein